MSAFDAAYRTAHRVILLADRCASRRGAPDTARQTEAEARLLFDCTDATDPSVAIPDYRAATRRALCSLAYSVTIDGEEYREALGLAVATFGRDLDVWAILPEVAA